MPQNKGEKILNLILEAHREGVKAAIEESIRTGVPLVVSKNGKITEIKPKYKYVKVPIRKSKKRQKKSEF